MKRKLKKIIHISGQNEKKIFKNFFHKIFSFMIFFRSDYTAWIWLWRGRHVDVCVGKNILCSTTNLVKIRYYKFKIFSNFTDLISEVLRTIGLEIFF